MRKILIVDDDYMFFRYLERNLKDKFELHWLPTVNGLNELHNSGKFFLTVIDNLGVSLDLIDEHLSDLNYRFVLTSGVRPIGISHNFVLKDDLAEWINAQ